MPHRIRIDPTTTTPVFQQIVDQVVELLAAGDLVAGTKLPPVRTLAADLGVAANTVAKAYRQLEAEGHVETRGRNGTVLLEPADGSGAGEVGRAASAYLRTARRHGLDLEQAIGVLRRSG